MINITIKKFGIIIILVVGIVGSFTAEAVVKLGTLGRSLSVLDAWSFICPTGTIQTRVRIFDNSLIQNTASILTVSFGEDADPTLLTSSPKEGAWSPFAINTTDGPGVYGMVIRKSSTGIEDYAVDAVCINSLGKIIGPKVFTSTIDQ